MAREAFFFLSQKPSSQPPFLGFIKKTQPQNPTMMSQSLLPFLSSPPTRFFRTSSYHQSTPIDMTNYKQTFSQRMDMAGLKPHHRIAMGVSGGPDSIALCVLAAGWKTDARIGIDETNGCIDGLLAIIVDHGLRVESSNEANTVRDRVTQMGIKCEISRCDWPDGKPKQGHLQEMARDMRYKVFQKVCVENQIEVLLIAHHADDQAELFILRLSRNSGVLGLAGMAFTCQLFPTHGEILENHGILLVRPLLEFSKDDMYKVCQGGKQDWVEDPTNQSPLFARNRIRMSLSSSSGSIKSEMQAIISACRRTRSFIDKVCSDLINQAVTTTAHGYAIIDLEKLDPVNVEDVCLSKFVALVLQFISQRHRPVRGRTSKLLLNYMRNLPCKTSLTAAGCYLCVAPQSKGTKILVCCCPHSPLPSEIELSHVYPCDRKENFTPEIQRIIMDGKTDSDHLVPDPSVVPFLHATSSESILNEGKRLNIISESTHQTILLLQRDETEHFNTKTEVSSDNNEVKHVERSVDTSPSEPLQPGQFYHLLNRFLVTWRLHRDIARLPLKENGSCWNFEGDGQDFLCRSCVVGHGTIFAVRHMIDTDWLYLSHLSRGQMMKECQAHHIPIYRTMNNRMDKSVSCSDYVRLSAERALQALKLIPIAGRRGLPVLVNSRGLLLSIPSICFQHCPCLLVSAVFKPRVPLGGGHSSFI